jgi:hypothetical protein
MLRALSRPSRQYRSSLADPSSQIDDWFLPQVDVAYR